MKLERVFYQQDVLILAPALLGKMVVANRNGHLIKYRISETEAYNGSEDLACHASKGRTKRTEIMYHEGGYVYMYLIYGMHWMLNIVAGKKNHAQAVLIRGLQGIDGPGRVGRELNLDRSFYGEDLCSSSRLWIEEGLKPKKIVMQPRVGIDYAGEPWVSKKWRWMVEQW